MRIGSIDRTVISRGDAYHGWATAGRLRNGTLLAVCSGGRVEHVDPFGKVVLYRSRDEGLTWDGPETLVDGPLDDRDAGVIETAKGTVLVNWFTSLAWMEYLFRQETGQIDWLPPATQALWRPAREKLQAIRVREELGDWIMRSEDGGATWQPRMPALVSSPHGPVQFSDGRLLHVGKRTGPFQLWKRGSSHESMELAAAESRDDGRSWSIIGTIPFTPGHTAADYHEPHVAEADGGRLVAQIRNHGKPHEQETLQTESEDGGRTWSVPHAIGVWGTPSHLLRLRDGRLLMTHGYRRPPFGNQARVSADGGRTWSEPLVISDDGLGPDLGYPSSVELTDGRILTLWYEALKDNPRAVLRQARWTMQD